jgi:hypothetical protein
LHCLKRLVTQFVGVLMTMTAMVTMMPATMMPSMIVVVTVIVTPVLRVVSILPFVRTHGLRTERY